MGRRLSAGNLAQLGRPRGNSSPGCRIPGNGAFTPCSACRRPARFPCPVPPDRSGKTARRRLRPGPLHQARVQHPDAGRHEAVHVGVRAQGPLDDLSDHADSDAVQRRALRRRPVPPHARPFRALHERRLHRRLSGRTRALHVGGRVGGGAAAQPGQEGSRPTSTRAPIRGTPSTGWSRTSPPTTARSGCGASPTRASTSARA